VPRVEARREVASIGAESAALQPVLVEEVAIRDNQPVHAMKALIRVGARRRSSHLSRRIIRVR
jgi:hypothetical protein